MTWSTLSLAIAGGLGVVARHTVQRLVPRTGAVPWGTFIVNVSGALVMGLLLSVLARRFTAPMWVQEALFVGLLGGYTTFSALSAETFLLLEQRHFWAAIAYSIGSLVAGLVAVSVGLSVGRLLA